MVRSNTLKHTLSTFVVSALSFSLMLSAPNKSAATFSVVVADQNSKQVGGATASCTASLFVNSPKKLQDAVYRSVPGIGVLHGQGYHSFLLNDRAKTLMSQGSSVANIISQLNVEDLPNHGALRQYGIVKVNGDKGGWTGSNVFPGADGSAPQSRQGYAYTTKGVQTYSVQGNFLTSLAVLNRMEDSVKVQGCNLPEKLMLSLEAGARNGGGDNRCITGVESGSRPGLAANDAYIRVDNSDGTVFADLKAYDTCPADPDTGAIDPNNCISSVVALRQLFESWKTTHPCFSMIVSTDKQILPASTTNVNIYAMFRDYAVATPNVANAMIRYYVITPSGRFVTYTSKANKNGNSSLNFRVLSSDGPGTYGVSAEVVSGAGIQARGTTQFTLK